MWINIYIYIQPAMVDNDNSVCSSRTQCKAGGEKREFARKNGCIIQRFKWIRKRDKQEWKFLRIATLNVRGLSKPGK